MSNNDVMLQLEERNVSKDAVPEMEMHDHCGTR